MTDKHALTGISDTFGQDLDALADLLDAEGVGEGSASVIAPRDRSAPTPMSFSQELLWLLDRATPGMSAYNLTIVRRQRGPLDVPALERALTTLVARHEALRTRFADDGGAPRQIVDEPSPLAVRHVDLSALPSDEREREAERVAHECARRSFDLAREHLFQATLVRLAPDDHVLVIETHHIVVDGWSLGILFRELASAYAQARAGAAPVLPPVRLQFGDFAAWQRELLSGPRLEGLLDFWRRQLGEATEPLALPSDHPRASTPTFAGARQLLTLSPERTAAVRRLAQGNDATLYMVLLAAYATVLHRYTGRADVLIGSGSAGRTTADTEEIVGYLNNTLVQRASFAGDPSFAELLRRVRESALGAYDHQDVPLEKLVLELRQGQERLSHAPLFEVVLTMQDTMGGDITLEGLTAEPFRIDFGATKFDITLLVSERGDELALVAQYRSELFEPETMRRFLGHVGAVLDAAAADATTPVSRLPLLSAEERRALAAWNDTAADPGVPTTIDALVEAAAARVPARTAVTDGDGSITYAELETRANQLAQHLRALGVGTGTPVGLGLERSVASVVAMVGILKAGGAYVPVPPTLPANRAARVLQESGAGIVVTLAAHAGVLPSSAGTVCLDRDEAALAAQPSARPAAGASPDSLAYVLFTSGSTGVPKGVAVTHANAVHYTRAIASRLGIALGGDASAPARHFGMVSTFAADLGLTSLLPALASGGTLHLLSTAVTTDPARFAEYVTAQPLDVLKITPGHLRALVGDRTGGALAGVLPNEWLVLGGEATGWEFAARLLGAGRGRILNHYGPTETTVGVSTLELTRESADAARRGGAATVPIGRPLSNVRLHVLDAGGRPAPVGVPGELFIAGAGVARGYLNRPELTDERFLSVQIDDTRERVYRTGDRVRRAADGTLEFLGRVDDQVKVRGYRVELGEVEQALRAHPGVAQGVVLLRDAPAAEGAGDARLVAYAVPKQAGYAVSHADRPTTDKLREWLAAQLPEYMVPAVVVLLDALPLTPNGKVDRAALPSPDGGDAAESRYVEPRTETERKLVEIWQETLKKERVGVTDDFLDLGGHSLMAIRVLGKISKTFGVRLALRTLFDAPTVEQLAASIDAQKSVGVVASGGIGVASRDAHRIGKTAPVGGSDGRHGGAS